MATTLTLKGKITIPKHIRDALGLKPGCMLNFAVNRDGEVVLQKADHFRCVAGTSDRFEATRGKADVEWRTHDLMALLRDEG